MTSRGPARWERAALNAIHHPRSKAAKFYFARYALAREISDQATEDSAYQFIRPSWNKTSKSVVPTRVYATCSVFCTILQITLDFNTTDKADLVDVFIGSHKMSAYGHKVVKLNPASLPRAIRCQVCGGTV